MVTLICENSRTSVEDLDKEFEYWDSYFIAEDEINHRVYTLKLKHGNHMVETVLGTSRSYDSASRIEAMHMALDRAFPQNQFSFAKNS